MLVYLRTDLFSSPAQTLVNTVNTVGVMGKGIAKTFKERYPEMFRDYKARCERGDLRIGTLMLWRGPDKWVLNFPTKTTWRMPSRIEYLDAGLRRFVEVYEELGLTSVSLPPLGCGNGNLDWSEVKPLMEHHLKPVQIPVFIHDRQVAPDFVPEQMEDFRQARPAVFRELLSDVREAILRHPSFRTLDGRGSFRAAADEDGNIRIVDGDRSEAILAEELESAWSALQMGLLTLNPGARNQGYLFAILASLPYVSQAQTESVRNGDSAPRPALFFRSVATPAPSLPGVTEQLALWR